ncbi:DsbA family oxidoreductase [Viridibacillus sp. FSL R5-0477]|uniref:Protein-disulfide isomerase n=1 Tax=Viridibacillus arenosi FSL R5-213 TaxID=1227360 RepID=W4EQM6_9BACL|nr:MULTISPECIES: DsbA family oxidoreductase [Viridibacillus]ETT82890.1 protein-disulfide isomerase [Viridibacillus arenosi FSL R5-213]OMC82161.1 disulfide bond formation protein DsbA [Viridibacillus sp. FSL H8-0123]OMC86318.1 disulfide bond formation protein DsbA [Viridibacillus sp. FSL H7-0596]OMC90778.1 disulfide bond formation protein DsbA [Viridibacillus arenosi]
MKIEIWSDYVCPFCYIGKRQLEKALQNTGFSEQTQVIFKSYQLDPNTPAITDESMYEALAKKFGSTIEAAKAQTVGVAGRAKEVGLDFDFENMKPANTFKSHRLAKYAEAEGKAAEMTERLLRAHFIEAKQLGLTEVLVELAVEVGLNRERVLDVLNSDNYSSEVLADIQEASQIGVRGVPFFVLNRKYAISGAQPQELFEETIRKVAAEEGIQPTLKMMGVEGTDICEDGKCEL